MRKILRYDPHISGFSLYPHSNPKTSYPIYFISDAIFSLRYDLISDLISEVTS